MALYFSYGIYLGNVCINVLGHHSCHRGLQVPFGGILVGFIAGGFSIAATNGGIGLYPLAVAGAFTLFGVPEEPSTAFGSVMWAAQTAMVILLGTLFLLLPICNKAK